MEEPNDNHFLKHSLVHFQDVNILRPEVNTELCDNCGVCAQLCEYNALAVLPNNVMVFSELCHGCGLCSLACPKKAITEYTHRLGTLKKTDALNENIHSSSSDLTFFEGTMKVGEAIATPIIKELKKIAFNDQSNHKILDLPPGSACPVVEGLSDTDFVVLVTEPTPAGEHDLKIAIELVQKLEIPFGIVNNRSDIGDDRINQLASSNGYPLLLEVPHDTEILNMYSNGLPLIGNNPKFDELFATLWRRIKEVNN